MMSAVRGGQTLGSSLTFDADVFVVVPAFLNTETSPTRSFTVVVPTRFAWFKQPTWNRPDDKPATTSHSSLSSMVRLRTFRYEDGSSYAIARAFKSMEDSDIDRLAGKIGSKLLFSIPSLF